MMSKANAAPHVGLFVTCLVDMFRPSVGFSAITLLERAGCRVDVPDLQTCCGQPGYNSGDFSSASSLARQVIHAFESYDYVVAPSGSCAAMIKDHYPGLFEDDAETMHKAQHLAARTFELVSFLTDVMGVEGVATSLSGKATYHDSCSGLRELEIKAQPRKLLASVEGLELTEMEGAEVCCGFGGTFCVKYPEISDRMVSQKVAEIADSGADLLLAGDLGCLMNMAGKLSREGLNIDARHVAEVLAGDTDEPAIGKTVASPERGR